MSTIFWNRNISDEAHEVMKEFTSSGQDIMWVAFAPPGGNHFSIITNKTFFNRNIPQECHDKMVELQNAGHHLQCVAFPPEGGNRWSLVTDKTFVNRNIPQECHDKMVELRNAGHQIRCVAFPPDGGNRWSVVTDKTFFNRNIPQECHDRMVELRNGGHSIISVAFSPQGGNRWSIVTNKGFFNRNVPDELHRIIGEIYTCHGPMRVVAFDSDGSGWSVAANAKAAVIYRLPFGNESGMALWNGNWDDPVAGHGQGDPNGLQAFAFDFVKDADKDGIGDTDWSIRAARGGKVYAMVEAESGNSFGDGNPPGYTGVGNFLVIDHGDGTFGTYWHIKKDGVLVKVGDTVKRGDKIAVAGNTGHSSTSHLHFDVRTGWSLGYPADKKEFPSVKIRFEAKDHICWIPRVGDALASNNA